jgi:hypothetical protein
MCKDTHKKQQGIEQKELLVLSSKADEELRAAFLHREAVEKWYTKMRHKTIIMIETILQDQARVKRCRGKIGTFGLSTNEQQCRHIMLKQEDNHSEAEGSQIHKSRKR